MPVLKKEKKKAPPLYKDVETHAPERPYANMRSVFLGSLKPGDIFWCPDGGQYLSGVLLYQGFGSSRVRVRATRPISHEEYVEECSLSLGSIVLVEEKDEG